ncbi:MAG: tetratricopeptide repeat protein [Anaerolineae bacterium]|nr:tetratricopeptide repeat protein [Anaerolineae bacterium]
MTIEILTTKLYIPRPRPELVARPRLLALLEAGLHRKLTLIAAPAGFGKTTLLSAWATAGTHPCAWLSLDETDNDPARFLTYLVAALNTLPTPPQPFTLPDSEFDIAPLGPERLTTLLNQMAALPTPCMLVLDDFHLIHDTTVHEAIAFLLEHLPPTLHLVIATRADPPLPVARLRARGQITELRSGELRFTHTEAAAFLNSATGIALTEDHIATLTRRTEGWAAGLQMASLALQAASSPGSAPDVGHFIHAFAGSNRFVLDYFIEEVLENQTAAIQDFLLCTSILTRLNGALCDALLSDETTPTPRDSAKILHALDAANLFLVPLDDQREWYRYHQLFADLLQNRLTQIYPDMMPKLHHRASLWYEAHAQFPEAIAHTLQGADFERAATLIEQVAEAILMRSEIRTFLSWVEQLPESTILCHPTLCLYHAWILLMMGHPWALVESRLEAARQATEHFASQATSFVPAKAAPLLSFVALYRGEIEEATELATRALAEIPPKDTLLHSLATWSLGISHFATGKTADGKALLEEVTRTSRQAGNILVAALVLCHQAEMAWREGKLHQAQQLYEQALDLATDADGQRLPIAGNALIGLGEIYREWNALDAAEEAFKEGIALTECWSEVNALDGYIGLIQLQHQRGDHRGAETSLRRAEAIAEHFDTTDIDDLLVALLRARINVHRAAAGDLASAAAVAHWLEERGLNAPDLPPDDHSYAAQHLQKYELLILARWLHVQGKHDAALNVLQTVLPRFVARDRPGMILEILTLQAVILSALGREPEALDTLEQALNNAAPEGYLRIFLDEGPPLRKLLEKMTGANKKHHTYAATILAAFEAESKTESPPAAPRPSPPLTPTPTALLSEREMEVLQLLPSGLSISDIANHLYISSNTARSHLKSIYSKLEVHSRYEAVARAQELGLI